MPECPAGVQEHLATCWLEKGCWTPLPGSWGSLMFFRSLEEAVVPCRVLDWACSHLEPPQRPSNGSCWSKWEGDPHPMESDPHY